MQSANFTLITYVLLLKRTIDICTRKTVRNSDWSRCMQKMPACTKMCSQNDHKATRYYIFTDHRLPVKWQDLGTDTIASFRKTDFRFFYYYLLPLVEVQLPGNAVSCYWGLWIASPQSPTTRQLVVTKV